MKINPTVLQNAMAGQRWSRYQTAQKSGVPEGRIKQIIMTKHCSIHEAQSLEIALGVEITVEEEKESWNI